MRCGSDWLFLSTCSGRNVVDDNTALLAFSGSLTLHFGRTAHSSWNLRCWNWTTTETTTKLSAVPSGRFTPIKDLARCLASTTSFAVNTHLTVSSSPAERVFEVIVGKSAPTEGLANLFKVGNAKFWSIRTDGDKKRALDSGYNAAAPPCPGRSLMRKPIITLTLLLLTATLRGADTSTTGEVASATDNAVRPALDPTWTVSFQGGFTNTFQLVLGGMFGKGPDFQDRMAVSLNNVVREGDSLSVFGWDTLDLPGATPNWQGGLLYKTRLLKKGRQALYITGGGQRWVLPLVGSGAKDWMVTGNLNYLTTVKGLPINISEDFWGLLKSTLPTGSATYTQISTQHVLFKREGFQLALRHGPAYSYSWGFYGVNGSRVMRYTGTLVATWKGNVIEGGCRQQFGLQDDVHNMRYWSILVSRQFNRPFAFWLK